jgi:hypothetical protein
MTPVELRCEKEYMVRNEQQTRCVLKHGHQGECQLTLWWSLKVEGDLGLQIGVGIDAGTITVRRVK